MDDPSRSWVITRRDLALSAMRDSATFTVEDPRFSTARVIGPMMLSLDGAEHQRHRGPFAAPFRLRPVRRRFGKLVSDEVDALIDAWEGRREADLSRALARPLAATIVMHALGLHALGRDAVLGWYEQIVASVSGIGEGAPPTPEGAEAFAALAAAVDDHAAPGSLLAGAAGEGRLTREEVVSNAAVLMFGGIETTEGMIANVLWHLLTHPDELARVREDLSLVPNAVEESLRLEPAAASIDRYATHDVEFGGLPIRAGDLVTISIAAANRDPEVFDDPDRYDVERENARLHLAFAHGPHVCIGMHLARLEAHTAVRRVLERLPGLRLVDPEASAPRGTVFRKPPELRASWLAAL